jgi:glycosyltransferase involved in cell wall biosynthesis
MRILLLSSPGSVHTIKWANSLVERGVEVAIFGLSSYDPDLYNKKVEIRGVAISDILGDKGFGSISKLKYLKVLPSVKKIIREFKPDILHAHLISSYGLIGVLSTFHPLILSVWGGDVFLFPQRSFIHKILIKYLLYKSDKILSTSYYMAKETQKYTAKSIEVTPFGVDLDIFYPFESQSLFDNKYLVIGTIKGLEVYYGIEYLLEAFKIVRDRNPFLPLKLLIVGGGSQEQKYRQIARTLKIDNDTLFTGYVSYAKVPDYHNKINIFVAISVFETFGVAVVEAQACGKPVVVSNTGGLPEVVNKDVTGFIVPPADPEKAADSIEKLVLNEKLRSQMGNEGRNFVEQNYDWNRNVDQMIKIYTNMLNARN